MASFKEGIFLEKWKPQTLGDRLIGPPLLVNFLDGSSTIGLCRSCAVMQIRCDTYSRYQNCLKFNEIEENNLGLEEIRVSQIFCVMIRTMDLKRGNGQPVVLNKE